MSPIDVIPIDLIPPSLSTFDKSVFIFFTQKTAYIIISDWQQNQVLTTVTTTALPVTKVPFPAVTICSEGMLTYGYH
jgi:hypothetical protein